ncbi:MAG: hypothetical protein L7H18_00675 [Candidatus Nealsonbacteria bacterium DGGOD1a]|nr:MAG: hypothetical protein L7H18_00675 [Candidatus Nealsonbacteria bacterium DGGOD1a]
MKQNNSLPTKTRLALIKTARIAINKQIDLLVKEIKMSDKGIDAKIIKLLIDSLENVKIK